MLAADWKQHTIHLIDFEGSARSGVVEFGVVTLHAGVVAATWTGLCRPQAAMHAAEIRVHGLAARQLEALEPFGNHFDRFVQLRRSGVFGAHNQHAENTFLRTIWPVPAPVPDWLRGDAAAGNALCNEWGPWLDTLGIYRRLYPQIESYALADLVDTFKCREWLARLAAAHCPADRAKQHCALYDALGSAVLLLRIEQEPDLRDRIQLGWLLSLSGSIGLQAELF